jgi:hypothetical protein
MIHHPNGTRGSPCPLFGCSSRPHDELHPDGVSAVSLETAGPIPVMSSPGSPTPSLSESPGIPERSAMPATPTVQIIEVDPATAESWLAKNPNNRNLRKPVVDSYARDMLAGNWMLNGETVKFDQSGKLIDGQHRLSAVVTADVTVPMVVVRGVDADVMDTVDVGAKRTYADALKLQGEDNTTTLAAVVRRAVMWQRGARTNTGAVRPTAREMNTFIDANPQIRTSAELAARLSTRTLLPASVIGLGHWLFSPLDPDDADWFLARAADGDGLPSNSPVAILRKRIVNMRVGGGRVNETDALALVIYAWNAHRAGETRTKLQMPRGGLTPENFPEPNK